MQETILVTQRCNVLVITEQCLNNVKMFSTSHTTYQQVGWGCTRIWEKIQPGQIIPTDQRDIPLYISYIMLCILYISCSATKVAGKEEM